ASAVRAVRQSRRGKEAEVSPAVGGSLRDLQAEAFASMDPAAVSALGRELGSYPSLVGRLDRVACPTTVIVGERDSGLLRSARTLASGIPRARLAVIAGGDHSPQSSRPQAWLQAVERHLDRVEGRDDR
nr:alpha/beta hydrolase [Micromonospora sp. DSM 115978]